jgi:hypothetical protein
MYAGNTRTFKALARVPDHAPTLRRLSYVVGAAGDTARSLELAQHAMRATPGRNGKSPWWRRCKSYDGAGSLRGQRPFRLASGSSTTSRLAMQLETRLRDASCTEAAGAARMPPKRASLPMRMVPPVFE